MNYLVSYGHSGNTWVRYWIEYLTKRPTHGHQIFSISERKGNFLDIDIKAKPVLVKRHTLEDIKPEDHFILLLRNPCECIKRGKNESEEFIKYYSLILGFERHVGKKSIIYYNGVFETGYLKHLVKHHKNNFWFYEDRVSSFFDNIENHKNSCLSIYENVRNKKGMELSKIPEIYLKNVYIQNTGYSI